MLPYTESGHGELTLILMHFLGGSRREWVETAEMLSHKYHCFTVDLPGFGEAHDIPGFSVDEMADAVIELIAKLHLRKYLLVGHSMSGKVAAAITRRLIDGPSEIEAPIGLILVCPARFAGSTMSEEKRRSLIETLGKETGLATEDERESAVKYLKENINRAVPEEIFNRTVDDLMGMNRAAWIAWLQKGSLEDWSKRIGQLQLPTLILPGNKDSHIEEDVVRKEMLPYFPQGHVIALNCGHLAPLEEPAELASTISNFLQIF